MRSWFLLVAVAASSACSGKTMIANDVAEQAIRAGLVAKGMETASVSCPSGHESRAGETFICTAVSASGDAVPVDVSVQDDAGHVTWDIRGVVIHEARMGVGISENSGGAVKISCPDKVVVVGVGSSFECPAVGQRVQITITDKAGNETWKRLP